ncbi:MAG: glycosyltransferase family 2 protein [Clostridia bacterium]|nr:glycosyltransferase family 2 protein [Clostridia bacterium]
MIYENIKGVPKFECNEFESKKMKYCLCIPIVNEGERIKKELERAKEYNIDKIVDIIICDKGSTDGSTEENTLKSFGVNTLLTLKQDGKQGSQLRMGLWWALQRGYEGVITIDGNNKDSIEDVPSFINKLDEGYDFIQGSRYVKGGKAINTPFIRHLSVKFMHAPIISLTAKYHFTDTTNAYRGYSKKYLENPNTQPFRDIFITYELLAYLSVRASQLGLKVCEVPVRREYPKSGKVPTKISFFKGNSELLKILFKNFRGEYNPKNIE